MDEAERDYIAALGTRIAALLRARKGLASGAPGTADSIRRIARLLLAAAPTRAHPSIGSAAAALEAAADSDVAARCDELVSTLQQASGAAATDTAQVLILVVEDDAVSQAIMQRVLSTPSRRVVCASTIAAARVLLNTERLDLVIIDLVLPDGDGRNFLVQLREDPQTAGIPTMVVSALNNAQVRTECYALGCDAYVDKPVEIDVLVAATTSLLEQAARTARDARRDPSTRLPNRAGTREAFARMTAARGRPPSAVAMLDLDGFRAVNELLGSAGGDAALTAFAELARQMLRESDVIGRWGGEEFVVLMPDTDDDAAAGMVRALRKQLQTFVVSPQHPELRLSFTAGIASSPDGGTFDDALAEADRLLYDGKATSRGSVVTSRGHRQIASRTVLLAEDDPVIAALVRHRLSRDGFDVVHAANGNDALALAEQGRIALMILDVNMPGLSGLALLERLRKHVAFQRTPIMMLTSMGNESDIARALALGADDYVVKPFSPVELLARVRRLIARA